MICAEYDNGYQPFEIAEQLLPLHRDGNPNIHMYSVLKIKLIKNFKNVRR